MQIPEKYLKKFSDGEKYYEIDDISTAIKIFYELAIENIPDACNYLGRIYRTGDGAPKDLDLANYWYGRQRNILINLANDGNPHAALEIGKIFQYGNHIEINNNRASTYIRQAAMAGEAEAMFHLSNLKKYGWCGFKENEEESIFWLRKAAEAGQSEAMYTYGMMAMRENEMEQGLAMIRKAKDAGFHLAVEYFEKMPAKGSE